MGARAAAAIACKVLAVAFRVLGLGLTALTLVLCFANIPLKAASTGFVVDLTRSLPSAISGYGLVPTPSGGVFRTDFAIIAVLLLAADYALSKASARLRTRR